MNQTILSDQNLATILTTSLQIIQGGLVRVQIMLATTPSARPVASNKPYIIIEYGIKIGMYISY